MKDEILELLRARGLLSEEAIREARQAQRYTRADLLGTLVAMGKVSAEDAADAVAEHYGLERLAGLEAVRPAAELPADLVRRHRVFPVRREDGILHLAMEDPTDVEATDAVRLATGMSVVPVVCTAREIERAIQKWYSPEKGAVAEAEPEGEEAGAEAAEVLDAPAVKAVRDAIAAALTESASDVHIEPTRGPTVVRFRVDGALRRHAELPRRLHTAVISRIKVLAGLDITERRLPQDGRFRVTDPREADVRVSVLPTVYGEKAVLRIFDRMRTVPRLETLGYEGQVLERVRAALRAPYGMILVTGPTGAGKTTTLYAMLAELVSEDVNVVTVEDPPEYDLPGTNQVAVNPKAGLDFAAALRSILRQDPDVVMVGEIRDGETARVAVQAALTGHLVLSSLHTGDAASAPVRLVDMGADPYLVASSLLCVVAQRLVRIVCPRCREVCRLAEDSPAYAFLEGAGGAAARGRGCPHCNYTGHRGRRALAEAMPVTRQIRELIRRGASADEIRDAAVRQGMTPLAEVALKKAAEGAVTVEDAMRVAYAG